MNADRGELESESDLEQLHQAYAVRETNPMHAFKQFKTLAEKGSPQAMLQLGWAYQKGIGVPTSMVQAEHWFRLAYEKGPADVKRQAADFLVNQAYAIQNTNPVRAYEQFKMLAEKGAPQAMFQLGWAYQKGIGVPTSMVQAEHWFRLAYEKGLTDDKKVAALFLGKLFLVQNAYAKAHEMFASGAAMDYPPAIYRLARLYRDGLGVDKQPDKARELFEKASALGNVFARKSLALQLLSGQFGFLNIFRGFGLLLHSLMDACRVVKENRSSEQLRG